MPKYKITILRTVREEHEMELKADSAILALDEAREIVRLRNELNKNSNTGTFSVFKVEDIKEST